MTGIGKLLQLIMGAMGRASASRKLSPKIKDKTVQLESSKRLVSSYKVFREVLNPRCNVIYVP